MTVFQRGKSECHDNWTRWRSPSPPQPATANPSTVSYPENRQASDYVGGTHSELSAAGLPTMHQDKGEFEIAFGASDFTVKILNNRHLVAKGEKVWVHLDRSEAIGENGVAMGYREPHANADKARALQDIEVNFGTPAAADADGAVATQAATAAGGLATGINGALATDGVATFDVARNVVAAWTGTSVLTVTGTDEYGSVVVESSASGTSLAGKKAFKTITGISVSADVTGLTVGTGDVLGLPVFAEKAGSFIKALEDGADATAGAFVPGDTAVATATTGDVRGTYDPNGAVDGSTRFDILINAGSRQSRGVDQFAGS